MDAPGKPVPAEQPEPEERGLEEERRQALHRQWAAEHVADETRVRRPVHPELELLDEPCYDAHGDVDQQQRAEEAGQAPVLGLPVAMPGGLQQRDEEGQPDRDRHEQEVIDARRCELPPRKIIRHARQPPGIDAAGRSYNPADTRPGVVPGSPARSSAIFPYPGRMLRTASDRRGARGARDGRNHRLWRPPALLLLTFLISLLLCPASAPAGQTTGTTPAATTTPAGVPATPLTPTRLVGSPPRVIVNGTAPVAIELSAPPAP